MSSDLFYPFSYDKRRPIFIGPILFVPEFFTQEDQNFHKNFSCQEWSSIFNHQKIRVEFCSGNGQWIIDRAKKHPDILWIAVEIRFDRVQKIYKKIKQDQLNNCLVVLGMGELFAKYYLKPSSIEKAYINFADPWPKRKHAKNRICQQAFFDLLKIALKDGGQIVIATDDEDYMQQGVDELLKSGFNALNPHPFFKELEADYGTSFFEDLWAKKGKKNLKTEFIKL